MKTVRAGLYSLTLIAFSMSQRDNESMNNYTSAMYVMIK